MRFIFFIFFIYSLGYTEFKIVKVGTIDTYYKNKINTEELNKIIKEVEFTLESQLELDIFDIDSNGRPISLIYVKPSSAQTRLEKLNKKYDKRLLEIDTLKTLLIQKQSEFDNIELEYNNKVSNVNELINNHNLYLKEVNNKKNITRNEFNKIKEYDKNIQATISKEQKKVKRLFKQLDRKQKVYNRKVIKYNNLVNSLNGLSKNIEQLSRSIKVVKGNAIFNTKIERKSYMQNGKIYKTDIEKEVNERIEIYGFKTKNELRAIIAHEILHLVGMGHIDVKGALMNPILQENQKKELILTQSDIEYIKNNF